MRAHLYEMLGIAFLLGSGYVFFETVGFLARSDYVAGLLGLVVAFAVVRAGVDICRLALVREEKR